MIDVALYCRELETHLCRKNGGHMIRIAGPAFERVRGWAERGVPLKIACRGVDRYCERYYGTGPRRRPVRIEFCEADILDLFDDWRRAVGVVASAESKTGKFRRPGLASHIDRAISRLTARRAGSLDSARLHEEIDRVVGELDGLLGAARHARGAERASIVDRLGALDRELAAAGASAIPSQEAADLRREAESELTPFGARMTPEARAAAVEAAFERLVRETLGLPLIAYE